MSWLALTTASSSAIAPIVARVRGSVSGRSRPIAAITPTRVSWSSSSQPRRRSGQGIGQRSSSGAQNIFRV